MPLFLIPAFPSKTKLGSIKSKAPIIPKPKVSSQRMPACSLAGPLPAILASSKLNVCGFP